jgi:hypothetical protein
MRDNVEAKSGRLLRKSITTFSLLYAKWNENKVYDLHARTALELQLVPSIIENIAP